MTGELVKCEILWTRKCNLRCGYCGMYNDGKNNNARPITIEKDWTKWVQGIDRMHDLGCRFMAVYGAEPLTDFNHLPDLFQELSNRGIYHTIITNCTVPNTREKLTDLVNHGLHSLSVSFDGNEDELNDKSSTVKSGNGLETARWFKRTFKEKVRDTAVIFTLTKTNLFNIIEWIPKFAEEDIYVFFDLIHNDIGNPGSKCRNYDGIDDLLFKPGDEHLLIEFAKKLSEIKSNSKYSSYVHQSWNFIDMMEQHPEIYINKNWNCASLEYKDIFPSWLTIDYDGTARICDDFHIYNGKNWKFWDLTKEVFSGEFKEYWMNTTREKCKGCFWNTHFDANCIKQGLDSFGNYINNKF